VVTRNHPPKPGTDATDHDTIHPGLWLAFGDVSGQDFWRNKATIRHLRFVESPAVRDGRLIFATENSLQTPDKKVMGLQVSRITLEARPEGYLVVWESTFTASEQDVFFGDQEEMGLGVRVATAITEKNGGTILSSTGAKSAKATWGKAFDWCDYSGVIDGRHVGVTLMPDPANFRPSWFHNRDYGLMVANPFGRRALTQGDPLQSIASHDFALDCQAATLVVAQQNPPLAMGFLEHLSLSQQKVDDRLLLLIEPAGQDHHEQLPRLQDEVHGSPDDLMMGKPRKTSASGAGGLLSTSGNKPPTHVRKFNARGQFRFGGVF